MVSNAAPMSLLGEDDWDKPWLDPKKDAVAIENLAALVYDKRLLGNVAYYLNFQ